MSRWMLRLYPGWWRRRYGDEMLAVVADRPPARGDQIDLLRGAADAWLHPASPSWVAPIAALSGGGLWTVIAAATVAQPTPPDWPGYIHELVPLAVAAATLLLMATLGCALRAGDEHWRAIVLASTIMVVACAGWIGAQLLTLAALADPATLAVTQTGAMIGTVVVGIILLRSGDGWVGSLLVVAGGAMLVPWAGAWLAFGAAWTAVGVLLVVDRLGRVDRGLRAT